MDVTLPKWGMTMQEATISEWLVTVGDAVTEGQPIVRIESDKVEADVEAPGNGTVSEIVVGGGGGGGGGGVSAATAATPAGAPGGGAPPPPAAPTSPSPWRRSCSRAW